MADVPPGLMAAFWDYERALMINDVDALNRLFSPSPHTLRGDAAGLLVGHEMISSFRGSRGGAPARRVVETRVQVVSDDHALIVAITELARGGRGQQTQLWAREDNVWRVTAAHVSVPAPAFDSRIWRVVADPLVGPSRGGPLAGQGLAVKDLYAVAGQRIGAGNPTWLAAAPREENHARAVSALLEAGAHIVGITRTDEFAYSLAGTNAHYGTPPNPSAPHRIPGGSSSGSASAVALGHATIGLGTDTGGSIRVPAAYQGLWGIRTTHGALSTAGLMPLATSFDTVGWLTRDPGFLAAVGDVLLPPSGHTDGPLLAGDLVAPPDLLGLAQADVTEAIKGCLRQLGASLGQEPAGFTELSSWRQSFQTLQAWEAWHVHGAWLETRLDSLGADVRGRFEVASRVTTAEAEQARGEVAQARQAIREYVGARVIVVPSASSVAPLLTADLASVREATLNLTCIAGIGGLPAVNVPLSTGFDTGGLPCGLCVVAGPGRDRELLALVEVIADTSVKLRFPSTETSVS